MSLQKKIESLQPIPMKYYHESFVSNNRDERIQVQYFFDKENGHFYAELHFAGLAQGPPGHVHGGAVAAVLDEVMGGTAWLNNIPVMTAQLNVSFLAPLKLDKTVYADSWLEGIDGKKVFIKSKLIGPRERIYAIAEGVFVRLSKEKLELIGGLPDGLFRVE
jgi:acyl-coenzyme A thioesterase PaaI-like protein